LPNYATDLFDLLEQAVTMDDIKDVAAAVERVEPELDRHAFNALHLAIYIKQARTRSVPTGLCGAQ